MADQHHNARDCDAGTAKLRVLDLPEYLRGRSIWFDFKGYACVWHERKTKKLHVLIWEAANGPKPPKTEIHHRDEDKGNWALSNLELLTNTEHQRLHAGWVRENGVWTAKPCTACNLVLPLSSFYERKGYTPSARCKPCHCKATDEWGRRNIEKRRARALAHYHRTAKAKRHAV
jgi:hypothetical protein